MPSQALVLGGGGPLGIAWETGLIAGLLDEGVDLSTADLILGTSAGSVAGAQLACGKSFAELRERLAEPVERPESLNVEPDLPALGEIMQKWPATLLDPANNSLRAEVGAIACRAKTAAESDWLGVFEDLFAGCDWPAARLAITGVDVESGEFVVWEKASRVPLVRAVASSCTIPGVFPPVEIASRRYMDGGVRSFNSADVARGHERVIVASPFGAQPEGLGATVRQQLDREVEELRTAGSRVEVVLPDDPTQAAMGPFLIDASKSPDVARTGYEQGTRIAARIANMWAREEVRT